MITFKTETTLDEIISYLSTSEIEELFDMIATEELIGRFLRHNGITPSSDSDYFLNDNLRKISENKYQLTSDEEEIINKIAKRFI